MFTKDLHLSFLKDLNEREISDAYMMMEHIRINGIYWALTALCTLGYGPWTEGFEKKSPLSRQQIIDFVASCKHPSGMNIEHERFNVLKVGMVGMLAWIHIYCSH